MGTVSIDSKNRKKIIAIGFMVFAAAFLVYVNTLLNDFIWDDEYLILHNSQVQSFKHIGNVFKTYVGYGSENINNFYRPFQEVSNMLNFFLWGEHPFGFHLTSVVLHALVSVLVFLLIFYLAGDIMVAAIAAFFYAVHPVHSEAVAYIAGQADPLYSVFMLLSLILFIRSANKTTEGKKGGTLYIFSIIFFIFSLLSKEIVIVFPLVLLVYIFYFIKGKVNGEIYKKLRWRWVPYAAIVGIYAYLRLTVLNFSKIAPPLAFEKIPLALRILTFFRSVGIYLRLLVFPYDLHMERRIAIAKSAAEPLSILTLVMIILLIWLIVKTYKKQRLVSFAIIWFFICLLPVSNVVPINSFLAEHWIYMASIGPFLLLGLGSTIIYRKFCRGNIKRILFILLISGLLSTYSLITVMRNADWKDEITFFESTLRYHPTNTRLYLNMGNTYYEKGEIDKAIEQYEKAIAINPGYAIAYGNIGSAYMNKKDIGKAEEYLVKALKLKYNYPIAHYNLGIVYFQKRRYKEALGELSITIEQLPQFYQAWNVMGQVYLKLGDTDKAKNAFNRSLEIMPDQVNIRKILNHLR